VRSCLGFGLDGLSGGKGVFIGSILLEYFVLLLFFSPKDGLFFLEGDIVLGMKCLL